jgi:hypothetical protein
LKENAPCQREREKEREGKGRMNGKKERKNINQEGMIFLQTKHEIPLFIDDK